MEYVKDEGLVAECRSCCVAVAAGDDGTKYTSAKLVVCPFKLNGLPAIQDFIDKHAAQYGKALKVERLINSPPTLVLRHKASGATKSVRIDMWKVSHYKAHLLGTVCSWCRVPECVCLCANVCDSPLKGQLSCDAHMPLDSPRCAVKTLPPLLTHVEHATTRADASVLCCLQVPTIHEFLQGRLESWGSKKKGAKKAAVETSKK